jgi:hypothetical protein
MRSHPQRGSIDASPMMMVPVFLILVAGLAFVAVRNEMIKDETREIEAEIEALEADLQRNREDTAQKIAMAELAQAGADDPASDAIVLLEERIADAEAEKHRYETETEEAIATSELSESRIESLENQITNLELELDEIRRAPLVPGAPPEPEPDPAAELFAKAEARSALVMRMYDLASARITFYTIDQVFTAETRELIDTPACFRQVLSYYYGHFGCLRGGTMAQRYSCYKSLLAMHDEATDWRRERLRNMGKALKELAKIERETNREAAQYDREYLSIWIPLIEAQRDELRTIEVRRPVEPRSRVGHR